MGHGNIVAKMHIIELNPAHQYTSILIKNILETHLTQSLDYFVGTQDYEPSIGIC